MAKKKRPEIQIDAEIVKRFGEAAKELVEHFDEHYDGGLDYSECLSALYFASGLSPDDFDRLKMYVEDAGDPDFRCPK